MMNIVENLRKLFKIFLNLKTYLRKKQVELIWKTFKSYQGLKIQHLTQSWLMMSYIINGLSPKS